MPRDLKLSIVDNYLLCKTWTRTCLWRSISILLVQRGENFSRWIDKIFYWSQIHYVMSSRLNFFLIDFFQCVKKKNSNLLPWAFLAIFTQNGIQIFVVLFDSDCNCFIDFSSHLEIFIGFISQNISKFLKLF